MKFINNLTLYSYEKKIYGFQRDTDARKSKDTKDKESCRWYHPCFRPGRRDLFHLIRRKATRYSRKRKTKPSNDEDPETILNLGSADESEIDEENQENMILLVNNEEHHDHRSSSVSSVTQSMQPIDCNPTSSQLQLGFSEPAAVTTTTMATAISTNSPRLANHTIPLVVNTNINMTTANDYHSMATPPLAHNNNNNTTILQQDDLPSDNADDRILDNGLVVNMQHQQQQHHHFEQQQQQLHQPLMHNQELRLQLYHMKQHYEKMHVYFKEQLSTAQVQIDEQKIRIQQLEGALGITKHSVKQSTTQQPAAGGYMSTVCTTIPNSSSLSPSPFNNANYNFQQQQRQINQNSPVNTPRLVTANHRSMYQMQNINNSNTNNCAITTTPRPNNFYFHENSSSSPSMGNTNNNNNIDNSNNNKMIVIKSEIISSPSTPSTSSNSWLPYHIHHRDSLSTAVESSNSNSNNGMVTAGSSTNQSTTTTATDSTKLKSALPSLTSSSNTPLIVHSNINSNNNINDNSDNHDTSNLHNNSKIDLMDHVNFNTFI